MTPQEIFQKLERELGSELVHGFTATDGKVRDAFCEVTPTGLHRVAALMKSDSELGFEYLECLTGIDFPKEQQIQLVYHLYSYAHGHRMVLKTTLDRREPVAPTLSDVWSAANWQERECYDLLGVVFHGHPDLRRLLLPEDWPGHPLRKDWTPAADYHGIPTTRPDPLKLLGRLPKAQPKAAKAEAAKSKEPKAEAAKPEERKAEAAKPEEPKAEAKPEKPKAEKPDEGTP